MNRLIEEPPRASTLGGFRLMLFGGPLFFMPPRQLLVLGNQLSFLPESFSNLKGLQLLGLKSHPGSPQKMVAKKGVIFLSRSKR